MGQLYSEFQEYVKAHKDLGILLAIDSKNDEENALAGLRRPDSVLKPEDFLVIKANWTNKDQNIIQRFVVRLNWLLLFVSCAILAMYIGTKGSICASMSNESR